MKELPYVKRNAYISWKHRDSSEDEYENQINLQEMNLNFNKNYPLEDIHKTIVETFFARSFFKIIYEKSSSCLAYCNNIVIKSFTKDAKPCTFWEFAPISRSNKGNRLKLHSLTTLKLEVDTEPDKPSFSKDLNQHNGIQKNYPRKELSPDLELGKRKPLEPILSPKNLIRNDDIQKKSPRENSSLRLDLIDRQPLV